MAINPSSLAHLQRSEFPIARNAATTLKEKQQASGVESSSGVDFADAIAGAIHQAAAAESQSVTMSGKFADGDPSVGIHEVIVASERANISLRYVVTLKNKVLDAYRNIMSTQV